MAMYSMLELLYMIQDGDFLPVQYRPRVCCVISPAAMQGEAFFPWTEAHKVFSVHSLRVDITCFEASHSQTD